MTPDQATSVGEALLEAGGSSSDSLSLPIAARRIMATDDFFPCNPREADILNRLTGDELEQYKRLRHQGATMTEALLWITSDRTDSDTSLDSDEIVGDVVAGLMDKWRLDKNQKRRLENLSQARDKIQPPVEVYAAITDRTAKNKLQAAVTLIGKHIEHAEKAVRTKDESAAEMSRGLARKKLMRLVETLAAQSQLSGYTGGLTEARASRLPT